VFVRKAIKRSTTLIHESIMLFYQQWITIIFSDKFDLTKIRQVPNTKCLMNIRPVWRVHTSVTKIIKLTNTKAINAQYSASQQVNTVSHYYSVHSNEHRAVAGRVKVVCPTWTCMTRTWPSFPGWTETIFPKGHVPLDASVLSLLFRAGQAAIKLPSAEASKQAQCTSPEQYTLT